MKYFHIYYTAITVIGAHNVSGRFSMKSEKDVNSCDVLPVIQDNYYWASISKISQISEVVYLAER